MYALVARAGCADGTVLARASKALAKVSARNGHGDGTLRLRSRVKPEREIPKLAERDADMATTHKLTQTGDKGRRISKSFGTQNATARYAAEHGLANTDGTLVDGVTYTVTQTGEQVESYLAKTLRKVMAKLA